jgi:hypothetical protein
MGSNSGMFALGALFKSAALIVTGSAQLSSINFANALASNTPIKTLS